jgi:ADP-ribose pyrophosphatase
LRGERVLESQQIYEGREVSLRVDKVVLPGGRKTTREVVEHVDCVAVVALDSEDNVLLVRQFRHPAGRVLLEIPAGGIEPGEEPSDSAVRELEEETGYRAQKLERLGGFYSSPGFCTEYLHLFLATELEEGRRGANEEEIIEVVPIPLREVPNLIASGEICDAKSIAGLLRVLLLDLSSLVKKA